LQYGRQQQEKKRLLEEAKLKEAKQQATFKRTNKPSHQQHNKSVILPSRSSEDGIEHHSPMKNHLPNYVSLGIKETTPPPKQPEQDHRVGNVRSTDLFYELLKADLEKFEMELQKEAPVQYQSPPAEQNKIIVNNDELFDAKSFGMRTPEDPQPYFSLNKIPAQPEETSLHSVSRSQILPSHNSVKETKSLSKSPVSRRTQNEDGTTHRSKKYDHVTSRYMDALKSKSVTPRCKNWT